MYTKNVQLERWRRRATQHEKLIFAYILCNLRGHVAYQVLASDCRRAKRTQRSATEARDAKRRSVPSDDPAERGGSELRVLSMLERGRARFKEAEEEILSELAPLPAEEEGGGNDCL